MLDPPTGVGLPVVLLSLALAAPAFAALPAYSVKDLGTLGGATSMALGINASGEVVGLSAIAGSSLVHAFVHDGGGMRDLGTFGGAQSLAEAISDRDDVIGWAVTATGERHAFLHHDGVLMDIGTLGGSPADARGINDLGDIVGSSFLPGSTHERAFLWRNGVMQDLGTLGGTDSRAYAINDNGDVVGFSRPAENNDDIHAFVWRDGVMEDLGTLGGWASHAYDINDNGKIVGWSMEEPNYVSHAYLWSEGVMYDLGTLGGVYSAAFAINRLGEIVGVSTNSAEKQHAFYCNGAGPLVDLNTQIPEGSGWLLNSAIDLNDQGQIVGAGTYQGASRAFLLTPLRGLSVEPERGTLSFAGAAPNPAWDLTRFSFSLPAPGPVRLELFDVGGRRVRSLLDRDFGAGVASVTWDGRTDHGSRAGAGIYWARFEAAGRVLTRRLSLLR